MKRLFVLIPVFAFVLSGCYHTMITTGKEASSTVIEKPWAKSFINGLVPPDELDVSAECPNGVAIVETELSFLNLVASAVTFGIFSPMTLTVTCAAGGMSDAITPEMLIAPEVVVQPLQDGSLSR